MAVIYQSNCMHKNTRERIEKFIEEEVREFFPDAKMSSTWNIPFMSSCEGDTAEESLAKVKEMANRLGWDEKRDSIKVTTNEYPVIELGGGKRIEIYPSWQSIADDSFKSVNVVNELAEWDEEAEYCMEGYVPLETLMFQALARQASGRKYTP